MNDKQTKVFDILVRQTEERLDRASRELDTRIAAYEAGFLAGLYAMRYLIITNQTEEGYEPCKSSCVVPVCNNCLDEF